MTSTSKGAKPDRSRLRPELRSMLEELDGLPPVDYARLPPAEERAASLPRLRELWGEPEAVASIEDRTIRSGDADIRLRIYRPAGAQGTVLFLHGGGWVVGDIDTHDGSCRMLANRTPATVVSVEYRKAPEHRFPAGIGDCDAALDWLHANGAAEGIATDRIVVCGESAGGNLAAVLAIHARERGIALAGQALIYPVIDTSMSSRSYGDFAAGYYLSAAAMDWFIGHYAAPADRSHPDVAPINAALENLAPAFVVTMDHDPLRDEGRAYAAALIAAGNDVTFRELGGTIHGLWVMHARTPATAELIGMAANWIRSRF